MTTPDPEPDGTAGVGVPLAGPCAMTLTTEGRTSATASGTDSVLGGASDTAHAETGRQARPRRRTLHDTRASNRSTRTIRMSPMVLYCRTFRRKAEGDAPRRRRGALLQE